MVFLLVLGSLHAELNFNDKTTKNAEEHNVSQDNREIQNTNVVTAVVSLDEENKRLKARVKELEAQIEAMKKGEMAVETETVTTAAAEATQKVFNSPKFKFTEKAPKVLSTYYAAKYQSMDDLKSKLEANGFKVLAVTPILKGKTVLTITNDELLKTNTWLATLHVLVNEGDEIKDVNKCHVKVMSSNCEDKQFAKSEYESMSCVIAVRSHHKSSHHAPDNTRNHDKHPSAFI
jgi:predicted RNase H-like nuclease (RuvC/YqgF family)